MKILKIAGANLASLAGEFCVDFEQEPLASSGLFAISGPTGAGKSTLLDALCLALYDAIPRLLKARSAGALPDVGDDTVATHDTRTLLRRGCAEGHAEVDFQGSDGLRYRARWSIRRANRKSGGKLQGIKMSLHQLPGLQAIGGTNTEVLHETQQRIGLSFEQFTRAVLLAQNEFSAFLRTDENDRGELLETLTGSDIYSVLSRRAFERFRLEEANLKQLTARLQDQLPMADEARAALASESAGADALLAAIDARKAVLEQQLRWQQELERLDQQLLLAGQAQGSADADVAQAGARRSALAAIEAAQPARALLAEHERLAAEQAQGKSAIDAAQAALALAASEAAAATSAQAAAAASLQAAEQAQRAAQPQLNAARALDASIAALLPAHTAGSAAQRQALADAGAARTAHAAKTQELAAAAAAQAQAHAWLEQHRPWEALASQWPRWDQVLGEAAKLAQEQSTLALARAGAQAACDGAARQDAQASEALAASKAAMASLDAARQQAVAKLEGMDIDAIRAQRAGLDAERDALASAEKAWTALAALRARQQDDEATAARVQAEQDAASAKLAGSAAAACQAALAQAEKSQQAAQLACAGNVASLRATLVDGEPCAVCGSIDHPYHGQDQALQAMLDGLEREVARCRQDAAAQVASDAAQRAIIDTCHAQLASLAGTGAALDAALATALAQWQAHPLASEGADAASFASAGASLRLRAEQLGAREQAAHLAAAARDTAQQTYDKAVQAHASLGEAAQAARAAMALAQAQLAAGSERLQRCQSALARLLEELGAVMDTAPWQADPAAFHAARSSEAQSWLAQSAQCAARAAAMAALKIELAAAGAQQEQAGQRATAAGAAFAAIDADISAKQAARGALWEGCSVAEVDARFAGTVDQARAALAQQQAANEAAAHAATRAHSTLAQLTAQLQQLEAAAASAAEALDAWLAGSAVSSRTELAALLGVSAHWRSGEHAALAALDAAAASARTIAAERQGQRDAHAARGHVDPLLAGAIDALLGERTAAHDKSARLRVLLAQDDMRRTQTAAMLERISTQQLVERRWARLNELIGSSDGRKFRNYAQQFTLDVLLGYANAHLHELARRYRLERIAGGQGPSLGLMVRDLDMGGEVRSVNSLSGGEAFLVSLALALGLASLSSNRVKVESLFIDEGFGSLDQETLQVAMDALDGLQSMGRKVGVISHVTEMTERIAARICVRPAGGGSSSVSVQP